MQAGTSALPDVLTLEHSGAILSTLVAAMVNDPNNPASRSEAEEVLRTCEGLHGYCDVLCHLFARYVASDVPPILEMDDICVLVEVDNESLPLCCV